MNTQKLAFFALAMLVILAATPVFAQEKQPFNPETMWEMKRPGNPVVSPDGIWTAFTVSDYDIEGNSSSSYIYMVNAETGELRQLTHTGQDSGPAWSPSGDKLAFVSRRHDGPGQIYILDFSKGGEARKVTDLPVGVYGVQWFPDGEKLAFAANILPEYNGDWDQHRELQKEMDESKVTAKVTENNMYRYWDRWLTDGHVSRLFTVDLESKEVVDLMPGNGNFFGLMGGVSYDISPDGGTIAVSKNSTRPPYERLNHAIYLVPTDGTGRLTNITEDNPANDSDPVYSPDGRYILYGAQSIYHFYADKVVMIKYDTQTGDRTRLTDHIDLSTEQWFWSEDGESIYFMAADRAMKSIFRMPAAAGADHEEIFRGGTNNGAALAGDFLVFNHHNLSAPPEVYRTDMAGNALKLTGFNDEHVENTHWGEIENVTYKGANDADIQMFINYPPDYDPNKKYPMVVMIHGGPHSIFGDSFHFRWNSQLFAAEDYIVILPNFHGSTSFGQEFVKSIHGNHSELPFRDIMKATDYMIDRGLVDEDRIAATGGSYGGYMVSWIAGHTDRFAALINHAGVYDLHLQFASDYSANRKYQYGGSPWENFDQLNSINPSQFAHNFSSPMLVIHGELDYRVPVAHGFMVYNIYKNMGLDARLVYYPDENHWILNPQNSLHWYDEFYGWLERYLK